MFYDKFVQICKSRGITPSRAAVEAGLSKSTVTKWKTTPNAEPTGAAIKKITEYFGITIAELMGETEKAPAENSKPSIRDEDIKFALFRGREGITDEMYAEVLNFAEYVARREEEKRNKE